MKEEHELCKEVRSYFSDRKGEKIGLALSKK